MTTRQMDKLIAHFNKYFEQGDPMILHTEEQYDYHVDVLLYKPNEKYPFYKLVTMGAGDYTMPKAEHTFGRNNEYIMFVSAETDLTNHAILSWYYNKLLMVASFAYYEKVHITYAHSFGWEKDDEDDEMIAAYIELPQIIQNSGILHCKLGLFKTVTCLQVVLLNQAELDHLFQIGPDQFSQFLYPESGKDAHFLTERHRSAQF